MPPWSPAKRVGFRFVFAYSVLYLLPFPVPELPAYDSLWQAIVPWVGTRVLHLGQDITVFPNGSGDTTFNYVQVLCFVALAAAVTLVWTALDSKRLGYARLNEWLRLYLRFALGSILIGYGSFKVIQSQFPFPTLSRLVQPFGGGLAHGPALGIHGFLRELQRLHRCRRDAGRGASLRSTHDHPGSAGDIGVLSHIVVLNFSYDVPVKLFSCHLLAMALFLVGSDSRRLVDLFLFNRPVAAVESTAALLAHLLESNGLLPGVALFSCTRSSRPSASRTSRPSNTAPPLRSLPSTASTGSWSSRGTDSRGLPSSRTQGSGSRLSSENSNESP